MALLRNKKATKELKGIVHSKMKVVNSGIYLFFKLEWREKTMDVNGNDNQPSSKHLLLISTAEIK